MKLSHVSFSTKNYEKLQRICFNNLIRLELRGSTIKVSKDTALINFNSSLKIFDCKVMIPHVFKDEASLNVDSLIVR